MTDRPILFSAPMVRALLAGRKTQTRRIIEPSKYTLAAGDIMVSWPADAFVRQCEKFRPRYQAGDRLWVREAWSGVHTAREIKPKDRKDLCRPDELEVWYWADGNPEDGDWEKPRPSLHMPRWASRITLEVTKVTVERLQDISEADALAEGVWHVGTFNRFADDFLASCNGSWFPSARDWYSDLWDRLNGSGAWDANPWVVAYTFGAVMQNIDAKEGGIK